MSYLGKFGLDFSKTIVIFEISILEFVRNECLVHTTNFGVGSPFSKVLWPAFSEGPNPGPGLLYRVCHNFDK